MSAADTTYTTMLVLYAHIREVAETQLEDLEVDLNRIHNAIDEASAEDLDSESLTAAEELAEAMRTQRKALLWILEAGEAAAKILETNQGGIQEAADNADSMAETDFYRR